MPHMNSRSQTLAAYVSLSEEILVTYVVESMKWSERKQLAGYIFTCCLAQASSSPLLAGSVVQSLLAVSLCKLAGRPSLLHVITNFGCLT